MINDEILTEHLAENINDDIFRSLVQAYSQRLYKFAFYQVHSEQDAEDIVQEALVRVYKALKEYTSERIEALNLRAWLFTITKNVILNYKRGQHSNRHDLATSLDLVDNDVLSEVDHTNMIGEVDVIREALAHVAPQYRTCIMLQEIYGYSQQEIARHLRISTGCVSAYVSRGRNQFRQEYLRLICSQDMLFLDKKNSLQH